MDVKTVLLLEDDPGVAKVFELTLKSRGYVVLDASAAETAIYRGRAERIDLLIADVTSPCCGIRVALQLKAWMSDLRIILTSGYPPDMWDEQQRAELLRIPSDSVRLLLKPFFPAKLLKTVEELIGTTGENPTAAVLG